MITITIERVQRKVVLIKDKSKYPDGLMDDEIAMLEMQIARNKPNEYFEKSDTDDIFLKYLEYG